LVLWLTLASGVKNGYIRINQGPEERGYLKGG